MTLVIERPRQSPFRRAMLALGRQMSRAVELAKASTVELREDQRDGLERYCPHKPWPKQAAFLALDCEEAFYGGAAGPGKPDALLMAALQYVHVPGYSALILRRDTQRLALAGAIMDRAKRWLMH